LKNKILHPFLLAAYPVLALLGANIEEVQIISALRSLIISVFGAILLIPLLKYLMKDWQKAAAGCSLILALFFSYGHVYNFLESTSIIGITLGRHRLLLPVWLILLSTGMWWIIRKSKDLRPINQTLNLIAFTLMVFPLFQIGQFEIRTLQTSSAETAKASQPSQLHLPDKKAAPDIYYIILDGYTRDDILKKFYQLDNTPFLEHLTQIGFYVANCSQSNYAQTQLSLASSLNFNYLDALDPRYKAGNTSRVGLSELIHHSAVRQALESLGYQTVAFETGFDATQLDDADLYLSSHRAQGINDFENLLIRTTGARVLAEGIAFLNLPPDWEARDRIHREQILYTLDELRRMPEVTGPKFVFAHIVIPHWPHVFGPNGESVHEKPDSATGYKNQVIFINKQITPILENIINNSPTPPVIILQGDHGSIIESPERRMRILNAYYLPDGGEAALYESISPVNSFRVILDEYFGDQAPLLEDKSFYSIYADPYNYQMISDTRSGCRNN
jgi:hypothetical protein